MQYGNFNSSNTVRISLKTKMILSGSLLITLITGIGACGGLFYFESRFKEFILGQQAALASSMADEIDGKLANAQAELVALAGGVTPQILKDQQSAQDYMDQMLDWRLLFDNGLYIFLPSGKIYAGAPIEPVQLVTNYAYRDYFSRTMELKKPYISEPYFTSQHHHHPVVMFTAPVVDDAGKVLAVGGGSIDLMKGNFFGKLADAKIGKTGYFCMLNRSRQLIIHPKRDRILRETIAPGSNLLLDKAIEKGEATGETVTSQGIPMDSAFRRLKSTGWFLSANLPQSEAYAAISKAKRAMVTAVPLILLLSVGTMWLLVDKLTAPLVRFTSHIKHITLEDEQKPAEVESGDEIGELAQAFNSMLSELSMRKRTIHEQLRLLQTLMDTMPTPVFYKDLSGTYLGCNAAFENHVGLSSRDIIGKTVYDIAPRDLADRYQRADDELAARQGTQTYEGQVRYADGTVHDVIFYKAVFTSSEQERKGIVGLFLDITERKRAEEKVRDMEERFHQLFFQNWDAVLLLSQPDYRVMEANPAAQKLFGYTAAELSGLDLRLLVAENDFTTLASTVPDSARAGSVQLEKGTVRRKDGAELAVSIRSKLVVLKEGGMVYCSFRDIGERIRLEKEMKETQAKLIHANRMTSLGVLTAGIAHEINNPNSFISINAALLADAWKDALPLLRRCAEQEGEVRLAGLPIEEMETVIPRLCAGLNEGSRRISSIVGNLKDFSRDQKDTAAAFDINKTIGDAAAILSHHIRKHTRNFVFAPAEGLPPARGRAQQVEQVIVNLVMNALQALPDPGRGVHVTTGFDGNSRCIIATVKDEGKGMPKEVLEHLTEPFFSTRLDEGGTGLGLSISDTIIKEHNGSLEFISAPGQGTTATLRLPAADVAPADTPETESPLPKEYQI